MDKIAKRKCSVCGKEFSPKVHNAIVCSDKCRKERKSKSAKESKPNAISKPDKRDGELRFSLYIVLLKPDNKARNKANPSKLKNRKS